MKPNELAKFANHWNNGTWGMCGKKKKYESLGKALETAIHYNQFVYRCEVCEAYHCSKYHTGALQNE